jgi:ferredoxin
MKVAIDQSKCVSGGQCVLAAPDVFDQREEDGVVILLREAPDPELYDQVREAAAICPAAAITLQES